MQQNNFEKNIKHSARIKSFRLMETCGYDLAATEIKLTSGMVVKESHTQHSSLFKTLALTLGVQPVYLLAK